MFLYIDLAILVAFCVLVGVFLITHKKNIKREGLIFLYHTKVGLKFISSVSERYKWFWKKLQTVVIAFGLFSMVAIFILLIFSVFQTLYAPLSVPPVMPLLPYVPQAFGLPPFYFVYWLIIIAIIATIHEFSHGIFASVAKTKVKSTGFGFLGPFFLAFVEPNEKQLEKKKPKQQLAVLGAGSFANFAFMFIFILLMQLFFLISYEPAGLAWAHPLKVVNLSEIESIGNYTVEEFFELSKAQLETINYSMQVKTKSDSYWLTPEIVKQIPLVKRAWLKQGKMVLIPDSPAFRANLSGGLLEIDNKKVKSPEQLAEILSAYKPGDKVIIATTERSYEITLGAHPENSSKAYLGVAFQRLSGLRKLAFLTAPYFSPQSNFEVKGNPKVVKFFHDFFSWLILVSLFLALFNMLPLGILDGGKFFYVFALSLTRSKRKAEKAYKVASSVSLLLLLALFFAWIV